MTATTDVASTFDGGSARLPRWLAIALVSLAGLLLEIGYTRIVGYKLWYYYTYLVIGLSLLGIGTGGVIVALSARIRRSSTDQIIATCSLWGALSIFVGYLVIAWVPIDTLQIWSYGTASSFKNLATLGLICFVLFATFVGLGVIVSVLLGRAGNRVGNLYFADLAGAGVACLVAVPLIATLGPPSVVALAALVFCGVGVASLPDRRPAVVVASAALGIVLIVAVVDGGRLPDIETDERKIGGPGASYSDWGPVFRVDVAEVPSDPPAILLLHDGTWGSGLHPFDGDRSTLAYFDDDPRGLPFATAQRPIERELIIGSAGGQEILTSLYYEVPNIEAVELNPVTVSLLEDHERYAELTGHLPDYEEVDLHQGDGRTYLARSDRDYDLVWYVAPDSYAANNAASSGAFVLSESYLYTTEMIGETLDHLSDDGMMVVQFGELRFDEAPLRTSRYVATAREALARFGIADPTQHIAVATRSNPTGGDLSTIIVKRTPFSAAESAAFVAASEAMTHVEPIYAPGVGPTSDSVVAQLAAADADTASAIIAAQRADISAVTDDAPFFWHFTPFDDVITNIFHSIAPEDADPEQGIGERVLLLLLAFAALYAAVFLLLPFVTVRRQWRALPAKATSFVYFACLGLGFMLFEITMIQRLVRFLGYPTYSLTVTLAAILVSAGIGSLLSARFAAFAGRLAVPSLVAVLGLLALFYATALDGLLDDMQASALGGRVVVAIAILFPLGVALGMFMPMGLRSVSGLSAHAEEYVAWSWAVNGFFSVIGSVLTTILAMTFGFAVVQWLGVGVYAVAAIAFTALRRTAAVSDDVAPTGEETALVPA